MRALGPERPGGQGLDQNQEESGNRAILALLTDAEVRDHVDLVITQRDGIYEVWARRGMIRFRRLAADDGRLRFEVVEQIGEDPIARQDHERISSWRQELEAAARSGHPTEDPNLAFIEPAEVSYPFACERIAQLFDSPNAPDLVISPKPYSFGLQAGQHGGLDVVQSRAPLAFAGPGVRPGEYRQAARHVDIAPTICHLMGFPQIDGKDASGRRSSERGGAPDVYLERQDGRVLDEILADDGSRPERVYLIVTDGLSNSELSLLLERRDERVRNLRRILDRAARFVAGSIVTFPSITWPSHATILTGAWCGHHDIVNPTYYLRSRRESVSPQGQGMQTEGYLGSEVETLYEAFHRALDPGRHADGSFGGGAFTASIHEPQGRGADHAPLEGRTIGARDRLKALTAEALADVDPRWKREGDVAVHREALLDARGLAQVQVLFDDSTHPVPAFVAHELALTDGAGHHYGPHHEGLRQAVAETDRRVGRILDLLEEKNLLDSTLFVITSDHGMAAQDVSLRANPARHPERIGIKAVTHEPMIWLRDLEVTVEAAADGRSARVVVCDNDADESGERPAVAGAEVLARDRRDALLARTTTNDAGVAAFSTPVDVPPTEIALSIRHPAYNPRHLHLDGHNIALDLRRLLYAAAD